MVVVVVTNRKDIESQYILCSRLGSRCRSIQTSVLSCQSERRHSEGGAYSTFTSWTNGAVCWEAKAFGNAH